MDRIDVWVQVGDVEYGELAEQKSEKNETKMFQERVAAARMAQEKRFVLNENDSKRKRSRSLNSAMTARDISELTLSPKIKQLLSVSAVLSLRLAYVLSYAIRKSEPAAFEHE